jgi:hypothetical protein
MADIKKKLNKIKLNKQEQSLYEERVASWGVLHRWLNKETTSEDILKALKVELSGRSRYAIIKRLHQRYSKLNTQEDFLYLEDKILE